MQRAHFPSVSFFIAIMQIDHYQKILTLITNQFLPSAILAFGASAIFTPFLLEIYYYIKNHPTGTIKYIINTFLSAAFLIANSIFLVLIMVVLAAQQLKYFKKNHGPPEINDLNQDIYSKNLVYLIHGTFNENAKWVYDENSILRKEISASFQHDVKFLALSWSGQNSELERSKASDVLLESIKSQPKDTEIFVICHSHGGNIVLDSARRAGGRDFKRVKKTAFLSVPVINIVEREVSENNFLQYIIGAYAAISLPIVALFLFFFEIQFLPILIGPLILPLLAKNKINALIKKNHNHINKEVERHKEDARIKSNSCFYICLGDEAHIALEIASSMGTLSHNTANRAIKAANIRKETIIRNSGKLRIVLGAILLSMSMVLGPVVSYLFNYNPAGFYICITLGLLAGFTIASRPSIDATQTTSAYIGLIPSAILFFSNTLTALSFGNPKYMCSVKYQIYPSRTPQGEWSIATLDSDYNGMAHSSHSHAEVIKSIAKFFHPQKRIRDTYRLPQSEQSAVDVIAGSESQPQAQYTP